MSTTKRQRSRHRRRERRKAKRDEKKLQGWGLVVTPLDEPMDVRTRKINWRGPIVCEFPNGMVIRKLNFPQDFMLEGMLMAHCLGVVREHYKDYHCFSLQDQHGQSHTTIVCWPTSEPEAIYEIRGRHNNGPRPQDRVLIQSWLDQEGIVGDDVHQPYGKLDDDEDYHERGLIDYVVTGLEGVYE